MFLLAGRRLEHIVFSYKKIVFETLMLLNLTIKFPDRVIDPDPNPDLSGFSQKKSGAAQ
jgi:hypothetical protein